MLPAVEGVANVESVESLEVISGGVEHGMDTV